MPFSQVNMAPSNSPCCRTCHIARMNPNHPFLRQGKIIYYQPEDTLYDSDTGQNNSEYGSSDKSDEKCEEKIKFIMENMNCQGNASILESCSGISNLSHDDLQLEDLFPTKLTTTDTLNRMVHILECQDEGMNHVILESSSSPMNFHKENYDIEEVVHTKLPTPAKPMTIEGKNFHNRLYLQTNQHILIINKFFNF